MAMLDLPRLTVTLSPKEATYGLKEWPVTSDATTAGRVRRSGGIGSVLSGLRHRQPQQLIDDDGTVLCVVQRSKALKGSVSNYAISGPDDRVLGRITRRTIKRDDGEKVEMRELRDDTDAVIGSLGLLPDEPPTTFGFYGSTENWATVRLRRAGGSGGWEASNIWTLRGMGDLAPSERVLAAAITIVAEPWYAAEVSAARRSQQQSERLQ